jgi:hypothetical protein
MIANDSQSSAIDGNPGPRESVLGRVHYSRLELGLAKAGIIVCIHMCCDGEKLSISRF